MLKRHNKNSNSSRKGLCSALGKICSRKISCFSIAGACCKLSGVCLFLLTFLLINPTTTSASALEPEESANYDDQISAQADSGVTISFSPTSGSASLTPTTSDGASAKININANVSIASTGGYTIYLGGKNAALTGEKTGQTIPGATTATTFSNMKTNTWGYAVVEGSNVPDAATYSALPQGQGISLESKNGNQTNINKTYAISFATKIGNDKPADVYSNQVTLSVTSTPLQISSLTSLANMQDMTTETCNVSTIGEAIQLKDVRDGKYYWVSKLADGKCWMTQNLDLDLSRGKSLTPDDSDVLANYSPAYSSEASVTTSNVLADDTGQRSWSLGDYRIINPTVSSDCGSKKSSLANCTSQFTSYATPTTRNNDTNAHYIVGNYYQWNTATAGTGGTLTNGQATSSICPKGWKLPTSNVATTGGFVELLNAYSIVSGDAASMTKLTSAPLYFVRGGYVNQGTNYLFSNAGNYGVYWSSTPSSNSESAYNLGFNVTSNLNASDYGPRRSGFSIRCIAR